MVSLNAKQLDKPKQSNYCPPPAGFGRIDYYLSQAWVEDACCTRRDSDAWDELDIVMIDFFFPNQEDQTLP